RLNGGRRRRTRSFGDREGADDGPIRNAGQHFRLLRRRASKQHRLGEEVERGRERDGRQGAADFLDEHAELEPAEAKAAMLLRYGDAEPALFGDTFPERGVERLCIVVQHIAYDLLAGLLGQEFARLIAEHLLLVGEIEVHGWASSLDSRRAAGPEGLAQLAFEYLA